MKRERLRILARDIVDVLTVVPRIWEVQTIDSRRKAREYLGTIYLRTLDLALSIPSYKTQEITSKIPNKSPQSKKNRYPCREYFL